MTHSDLYPVLMGAVAMASFVASLFFLQFWRGTHDLLFFYFAIAFAVDASDESGPRPKSPDG